MSGSHVQGPQFEMPRVPGPGSQVLILDYAEIKFLSSEQADLWLTQRLKGRAISMKTIGRIGGGDQFTEINTLYTLC